MIDPGPLDHAHLKRIASVGPISEILLTHGHPDHSEGAREFAERVTPVLVEALSAKEA